MNLNDMKNQEHDRAAYALKCVNEICGVYPAMKKEYRSLVLQTPIRIHTAGLCQTLAFYCSKMKDKDDNTNAFKPNHYLKMVLHVMKWLSRDPLGAVPDTWGESASDTFALFSAALLNKDHQTVMAATQEAQALATWFKRFAEAKIEEVLPLDEPQTEEEYA